MTSNLEKFKPYIYYECVVGSHAYGLNRPSSDVDTRGFYVPPLKNVLGMHRVPEQLMCHETDTMIWEVGKFVRLALDNNPNVLECLFTDKVTRTNVYSAELRDMADAFLCKKIAKTYGGYAVGQLKRLERDERTTGEWNFKHAMHMLRLLHSGRQALLTGTLNPNVGDKREWLLEVREGKHSRKDVLKWYAEMLAEFNDAEKHTKLREKPDYEKVNEWLVRVRLHSKCFKENEDLMERDGLC